MTFCYMFDVLLYCAIIALCEGVFSDHVQFEGFKPKKHTIWTGDSMTEWTGGLGHLNFLSGDDSTHRPSVKFKYTLNTVL